MKEDVPVKVILRQNVKGLGEVGEVKEVADGYARNFLIPRGMAVAATAENLNAVKQDRAKKAAPSGARTTSRGRSKGETRRQGN